MPQCSSIKLIVLAIAILAAYKSALAAPILNPENGHYYEFVPTLSTWPDANAAAQSMAYLGFQGHLVDISDNSENTFVMNLLPVQPPVQNAAWIGLNDIATEGVFEWTTGAPVSFVNWSPGEPNNAAGGEDFVHMIGPGPNLGRWNDFANQADLGFVVEFDVSVPEPSTFTIWSVLSLAVAGFVYRRRRR